MAVRPGIFVAIFDELADPRGVARRAVRAEDRGWDGFFVWDHIAYDAPVRALADPWVTLAAVAIATQRVTIGPMVTPLPRRRIPKLARETVTLDHLSGGRLVLGAGLGGDRGRGGSPLRGGRPPPPPPPPPPRGPPHPPRVWGGGGRARPPPPRGPRRGGG